MDFNDHLQYLSFHPGVTLLRNLQKVLVWSKTQRAIADNASARLLDDTLVDWAKMRQDFDRDRTKPNPYEEPETCELPQTFPPLSVLIFIVVTMATLRRQFDKDEDRELRRGRTPPHTVTSSTFIWNAIQIEEQQYVPLHTILNENHLFFLGETYVRRNRRRSRPRPLQKDWPNAGNILSRAFKNFGMSRESICLECRTS